MNIGPSKYIQQIQHTFVNLSLTLVYNLYNIEFEACYAQFPS